MLVYGDIATSECTGDKLARISEYVASAFRLSPGIARHGCFVAAFIEAGELLQAIADADLERRGRDEGSKAQEAATRLLTTMAAFVWQSWMSEFSQPSILPRLPAISNVAETLAVKKPEGYMFYALYPEAYAEAARPFSNTRLRAIGVRSIGTGLAAMVAVATGAPPPVTVRPIGHPFRRTLKPSVGLRQSLLADREALFAIVDEGPGLSGSSFGSIADWLERSGVHESRIHFFAGHTNDLGPAACERHRQRWRQAKRHVVDFDTLVLRALNPAHKLQFWISDLVGVPDEPLRDISAGNWRYVRYTTEVDWPPAHFQQERRKFLAACGGRTWLCKFSGLGREGEVKLVRAKALSEAGFTPPIAGLRHGFIVQQWMEPTQQGAPSSRSGFIDRVGAYLAFRARLFPTKERNGASLAALREMTCYNVAQGLGEDAARRIAARLAPIAEMERGVRRGATDNRMHSWEWVTLDHGYTLKTDAIDHCAGHDLIGCQDIAWDVVGAAIELVLSSSELERLCATIEHETGRGINPSLLSLLTPCYLAFQFGYYTLAERALSGEEAPRLRQARNRYGNQLAALLTRRDSGSAPATDELDLPK